MPPRIREAPPPLPRPVRPAPRKNGRVVRPDSSPHPHPGPDQNETQRSLVLARHQFVLAQAYPLERGGALEGRDVFRQRRTIARFAADPYLGAPRVGLEAEQSDVGSTGRLHIGKELLPWAVEGGHHRSGRSDPAAQPLVLDWPART